jgi:hypothetical protein
MLTRRFASVAGMGRRARPLADGVRRHPGGGGRRARRDEARPPRTRLHVHEVGTALDQGEEHYTPISELLQ